MKRLFTLAALAALNVPTDAFACGGFFCDSVPMDQSKERIIFAIDEAEGTVETHVQIFYQGAAREFAWIVPVPSVPEVALSSDALFINLDSLTTPAFWLQPEYRGDCELPPMDETDAAFEDDATAGGNGGITVLDQSQVGPYDQTTLQATSDEELITWLNDNGYVIPASVGEHLAPYIAEGSTFIALKLTSGRDAGDIAPVKFTYHADAATIPIVLTGIAATPDMRLQPYIFAQHRAVPDNYLHVLVNESAVNWFTAGGNYDAVITDAANEAGGQAFATDFAGSTESFRNRLWSEGRYNLDILRDTDDPAMFLAHMLEMGFQNTPQLLNLLREFIPLPQSAIDAGISESSFYNCLECYEEHLADLDFDPIAFAAALDTIIVQPAKEAEALFWDYPWVTRMTSSMSPDEMTVDPRFVLNPDLEPVSNLHRATLVVDCSTSDGDLSRAVSWIELLDGKQIFVPPGGGGWGDSSVATDIAAATIEETTATGQPTLVTDNNDAIDAALELYNAEIRAQYEAAGIDVEGDDPAGCGCDSGGAPRGVGLLLAAAALLRRRR